MIVKSDASLLECSGYGRPCPSNSKIATTCIDSENSKSFVCRLCNDDNRNNAFYHSQKVHSNYDQIVDVYVDTSIKYEQSIGNSPLNPVVHRDNLFTMEIDDMNGRRVTYVSIVTLQYVLSTYSRSLRPFHHTSCTVHTVHPACSPSLLLLTLC
jgi:hypothetical protein